MSSSRLASLAAQLTDVRHNLGESMSENPGCLGAIFQLIFGTPARQDAASLPYRLRDDFMSAAERSFYRVLVSAVGDRAVVFSKVNLADVFYVTQPNENQAYRNKIDRKHVDFLLVDPRTLRPIVGVELDDRSHQRADRVARDEFVDSVFATAKLPLIHVPAQASYSVTALSASLAPHLGLSAVVEPARPPVPAEVPTCPKCGVIMVMRTASRGPDAGKRFLGCPNYPQCRQTMQIEST